MHSATQPLAVIPAPEGIRLVIELAPAYARVRKCEKIESVMLSAAKHLQYLVENKPMQILRSAQDDKAGGLFHSF
jgi:hypothetical protein